MRMINTAHSWSTSSLQSSCRFFRHIEKIFILNDLPTIQQQLHLPNLAHHPLAIATPLFWSMEHYTTFPSK